MNENPGSILEAIAIHAKDPGHADKLCAADPKVSLTYGQMWDHIKTFSRTLRENGAGPGSYVMIRCTQDVRFLIALMGISAVGAVYVPVEKGASDERVEEIRTDCDSSIYIGPKPFDSFNSNISIKEAISDTDDVPDDSEIDFPEPEQTSEILYSTGTTGKSKGIELTHANDIALAENVMYGVEMKPDNVELIPMPLSHSHGLRRTYGNLLNGSSVIFINGVTMIKRFYEMLDKYHATAIDMAPSILSLIFKLSGDRIGDYNEQLDYIQLGSAPLPEDDKMRLCRLLPDVRLYNFYGTTESGCTCILDFNNGPEREHCIGKPSKNAKIIFADHDKNEMTTSAEITGFMATAGAQNMKGYFNNKDLTDSVMQNGFIYTNDIGYIDNEGYIYCLGRDDDVINCGGVKIAPDEIEEAAVKFKGVKDACCVAAKDDIQGQKPKLYISLETTDILFDMRGFKKHLRTALDADKVPKIIQIIDEIPRTFNGKLNRKILRAYTNEHPEMNV